MPKIPGIEEIDLLHSHACQAIGDPRRIQILYPLDEQPLNVTQLAQALKCPNQQSHVTSRFCVSVPL
jgi:hypothetical protein